MATGRPAGRPPKPTEQKRALGNPGHRPLPAAPAPGEGLAAAKSVPEPPPLGPDGRELWHTIWTAGRSWLSVEADRLMVELLCRAHDEAEEIRRAMQVGDVKRFYVVANGQHVTHPLVTQLKDLRTQMTAWLSALGFSPTDRARLGVGEVRQAGALDELEERRRARREAASS